MSSRLVRTPTTLAPATSPLHFLETDNPHANSRTMTGSAGACVSVGFTRGQGGCDLRTLSSGPTSIRREQEEVMIILRRAFAVLTIVMAADPKPENRYSGKVKNEGSVVS